MSLFKIFKESGLHHDHQYVPGLNELNGKFAKVGSCVKGGFYYTNAKYILDFISYGTILRLVEIPPNAQIRKAGVKWRSDKIILQTEYSLFDISTFEMLIKLGANISSKCITFAATHGKLDLLIFFIKLRSKKKDYFTAFESAAEHGQLNIIHHIIDHIDIKVDSYCFAIHEAIVNGHIKIVQYLLELSGVNELKSTFLYGDMPFMLCAQNNRLDILEYLIKKYPDYICYPTIIINATKYGHLSMVEHYKQHIIPNNDYAKIAAIHGHKSLVKFFVKLSGDIPNIIESLDEIIKQKDSSIAMYLLKKSHHIDNKIIVNSISSAIEFGHINILEFMLIKYEVNILEFINDESIKIAAGNNHLDMIKYLIVSGYKPTIPTLDASLKCAVASGHTHVTQYLIELGARVWSMKLTITMLKPFSNGNLDLTKILVENNLCMSDICYILYEACEYDHIDIIQYLIPKLELEYCVVDECFGKGVISGNLDIVKIFVNMGNITKDYMKDAIDAATKYGHTDIVEFLTAIINK